MNRNEENEENEENGIFGLFEKANSVNIRSRNEESGMFGFLERSSNFVNNRSMNNISMNNSKFVKNTKIRYAFSKKILNPGLQLSKDIIEEGGWSIDDIGTSL